VKFGDSGNLDKSAELVSEFASHRDAALRVSVAFSCVRGLAHGEPRGQRFQGLIRGFRLADRLW
jgi:hypothetical protein